MESVEMSTAVEMSTESVTVTERAARRIGEILKHEPQGTMLRVSVEGGGCSGFQYKFDMERTKAEDDILIRRESVFHEVQGSAGLEDPSHLAQRSTRIGNGTHCPRGERGVEGVVGEGK